MKHRSTGCTNGQRIYDWLVVQVKKDKERLIARLAGNLETHGDCLLWVSTGSGTKEGYGRITAWLGKQTVKFYIHHVFWILQNKRQIPDGAEVDHECNKRRCVKHLQLTTRRGNLDLRDARQKARTA